MSEKKAEPILTSTEVPVSDLGSRGLVERPHFEENAVQMPEIPDLCSGCGGHHGSVRMEIECMRLELGRLRAVFGVPPYGR